MAKRKQAATGTRAAGSPPAVGASLRKQLASTSEEATVGVDGHRIALTHLDRIYWPRDEALDRPALTKRDFIRYLVNMAPRMLPHLADRPLTLFRWPEGIERRRILVKHWEGVIPPFVQRVKIFSEGKGHDDEYLLCNNLATLIWLAQNGTLELHVWHSRIAGGDDTPVAGTRFSGSKRILDASVLEYPDYIVFDLDPFIYSGTEEQGREPAFNAPAFAKARQVAFWLKDLLDGIQLRSFVKTSGKTGLHVVVPINRTLTFAAVREIARLFAEHLLRQHPREITTEWATEKRTGKVFVDYNMNVRGKSLIAPYCPRGLPGAPVSMPVRWQALKHAYPTDFLVGAIPVDRRKSGAWDALPHDKQDLGRLTEELA